jgi:bifunctional aspartokinase / homoserine dehydrogenase 1
MKILKFGGTSIATAERIAHVVHILAARVKTEKSLGVVFSAYAGVTDQLIRMGNLAAQSDPEYLEVFKKLENRHLEMVKNLISLRNQSSVLAAVKISLNELEEIVQGVFLVKELTVKTLDYIMSFGERFSTFTISEALRDKGIANHYIDSRALIKTDTSFGKAKVNFKESQHLIRQRMGERKGLFIITGFIGSTAGNETTTLGRGGSDYSASIIGAALNVYEIEIWTDVDGVLTADPGKVKNAFPIDSLTYEEAMELSHFGAKVIYPPTMQPALNKNIPLRVKNTFNPDFAGSVISKRKKPSTYLIKGISSIDEVALIQIQGSGMIGIAGIAQRIFSSLAKEKINIILISQASSEHSICLAVMPENQHLARAALEEEFKYELREKAISEISVENGLTILAVVGENMRHTCGIAGRVFQSLGKQRINISAIAQGSSELNISMVISRKDEVRALNALHDSFFLEPIKSLHLFLVGTGLIGKTLLSLLQKQKSRTGAEKHIRINLLGIANIDRMLLDSAGIDPDGWEEVLQRKGRPVEMDSFVAGMQSCVASNRVFVDCTMADRVVDLYPEILKSHISIVTPNKKANARNYSFYKKLHEYAVDYDAAFHYETNVGAALPVISTIRDLLNSGDRILKIEGILSGTLSYIFNTFDGSRPFSTIICQAREMGYTEPDPREDLSGQDVGRKLLILIREAGYVMEMKDIKIENLIPLPLRKIKTVERFLGDLKTYDIFFEQKRTAAKKKGKVLRYVARYEKGKAIAGLSAVEAEHPFNSVSAADNMIVLYTTYYSSSPLVIRGPGAGAQITAAGVLTDILKIADRCR